MQICNDASREHSRKKSFPFRYFPRSFQYSKLGEKNVEFLQQSRRTPNALGEALSSEFFNNRR